MPTYTFCCASCGETIDCELSMTDDHPEKHRDIQNIEIGGDIPPCYGVLNRVYQNPGITWKGRGWQNKTSPLDD